MGTEVGTKVKNGERDNPYGLKYEEETTFADFIYNGRTGQVFGRTGPSWIKIFIFYVIFYAALAAFSLLCYYLFALTLVENRPKWILDSSIIGTNPGVGFRPNPDQDANPGSSLIWYRREVEEDAAIWYKKLENYTNGVEHPEKVDGLQICDYHKRATKEKSCRVDMAKFGSRCTKQNKFGYTSGEPCILIKLNRIYGWEPEPFGLVNGKFSSDQFERDMENHDLPSDLRKYIEDIAKRPNPEQGLDYVWISCGGENIGDQETIGNLEYYPAGQRGIPGYYYPYLFQEGYQSPFIMVQLNNPRQHTLINIECKAWARNIVYDKHNRLGSVHLELLID